MYGKGPTAQCKYIVTLLLPH